jgi:PleD family two-component response regulator
VNIVTHIYEKLKACNYFIPDLERHLDYPITVTEEYLLGFSVGITEYKPGMNLDSLLSMADKALYSAKKNGKNQHVICLADPS